MKETLRRTINPIVDEEIEKLTKKRRHFEILLLRTNVAKRLRGEVDLNEHADEIAAKACETAIHAKTKEFPLVEEFLLPGFNDEELKSGGFRFGDDHKPCFVTLYDANYNQILMRYMNQNEHALASMKMADRTRAILASEIGKVMQKEPTLSVGKAKELWLRQVGE